MARFGRSEDGTIIVMTLTWLMLMLVVGGMAVDFMRFESRRALLQSTADRAVLAAADLTQDKDRAGVVIDYFAKAGFEGTIVGSPSVSSTVNYNSVGVVAKLPMNTIFLKWLGIDELKAPAAATAVEGIANVEVSLIVDISGSMSRTLTDGSGSTRIIELRKAANKFVDLLLTAEYRDRISISLVPYSTQVNAGPLIMNELTMTSANPRHNFSNCVDFTEAQLSSIAMDPTAGYKQEQHFSRFDSSYTNEITLPQCPFYSYERIVPVTQNAGNLKAQISQLQPRGNTAIYQGMKWGLSLLDPSMNSVVSNIVSGDVNDSVFATRPVAYEVEGESNPSQKVIVLMTDGENTDSDWLKKEFYKNADDVAHWAEFNFPYFARNYLGGWTYSNLNQYTETRYSGSDGDRMLAALCTAAKKPERNIIIYTIAVDAPQHGAEEMAKCASSAAHYFNVTGGQMESTFAGIARQITELRLSL